MVMHASVDITHDTGTNLREMWPRRHIRRSRCIVRRFDMVPRSELKIRRNIKIDSSHRGIVPENPAISKPTFTICERFFRCISSLVFRAGDDLFRLSAWQLESFQAYRAAHPSTSTFPALHPGILGRGRNWADIWGIANELNSIKDVHLTRFDSLTDFSYSQLEDISPMAAFRPRRGASVGPDSASSSSLRS